MRRKIWLWLLVFAYLLAFLCSSVWAQKIVINVRDYPEGSAVKADSQGIESFGYCDNQSHKFDVWNWEQIDSNHVFVGFNDSKGYLQEALSGSYEESGLIINGPGFVVDEEGGIAHLCINNEYRRRVMLAMAKEYIDGLSYTIENGGIHIPYDVLYALIAEKIYLGLIASGVTLDPALVVASVVIMGELVVADSINELISQAISETFSDPADKLIKDNIFLWYTGSVSDLSQLDPTYTSDGTSLSMICSSLTDGRGLCWRPGSEMDESCENATEWRLYLSFSSVISVSDNDYCYLIDDSQVSVPEQEVSTIVVDSSTQPPLESTPDLHITSVKGGLATEDYDDMNHSITETLFLGQCVKTSFIARYINEADQEAKEVDFDWRADQKRDRFDDEDDKLCDENREDVDAGEKNTKTFNNANLCVSSDGTRLTLTGPDGSISSDFQFDDNQPEKIAKLYVFADVEEKGRDNGDRDISSETSPDEYVKIEITLGEKPVVRKEPTLEQKAAAMHIINEMIIK